MNYILTVVILTPFLLIGMEQQSSLEIQSQDFLKQLEALSSEPFTTRLPKIQQLLKQPLNENDKSIQKKLESIVGLQKHEITPLIGALNFLKDYMQGLTNIQEMTSYTPTEKQSKNIEYINTIIHHLGHLTHAHQLSVIFEHNTADFVYINNPNPATLSSSHPEIQSKIQEEHADFVLPTEKPQEENLGNTLIVGAELQIIEKQLTKLKEMQVIAQENNSEEAKKITDEIPQLEKDFLQYKQEREKIIEEKTDNRLELYKYYEREKATKQKEIDRLENLIRTHPQSSETAPTEKNIRQLHEELKKLNEEYEANIAALKRVRDIQQKITRARLEETFKNNSNGHLAQPYKKKPTNNTDGQ